MASELVTLKPGSTKHICIMYLFCGAMPREKES